VRIGVGRPERGERQPVADWVLRPFPADVAVDELVTRGADCTRLVIRDGVDEAMRRFNGAGPL
jgi:peptidyl-tRNA hydrolase